MSRGRLDGKVAIITGASTGLGPVMAAMFVREAAAAAGGGAIAAHHVAEGARVARGLRGP